MLSLFSSAACVLGCIPSIPKPNIVIPGYVRIISFPKLICFLLAKLAWSQFSLNHALSLLQKFLTCGGILLSVIFAKIIGGNIVHLTEYIYPVMLKTVIQNAIPNQLVISGKSYEKRTAYSVLIIAGALHDSGQRFQLDDQHYCQQHQEPLQR